VGRPSPVFALVGAQVVVILLWGQARVDRFVSLAVHDPDSVRPLRASSGVQSFLGIPMAVRGVWGVSQFRRPIPLQVPGVPVPRPHPYSASAVTNRRATLRRAMEPLASFATGTVDETESRPGGVTQPWKRNTGSDQCHLTPRVRRWRSGLWRRERV
jgi:hypothetical protein